MDGAFSEHDAIADWVTAETLGARPFDALIEGACERLWASGVPLARVNASMPTLHPLYAARTFTWQRGRGMTAIPRAAPSLANPGWTSSPYAYLVKHGLTFVRRRIEGEPKAFDFPVLADLQAEGLTDYAAVRIPMHTIASDAIGVGGMLASFATDAPGGFSDAHLAAVHRLLRALALACKMRSTEDVTRNLVSAYLGAGAGSRVLKGAIRHGDGETIRAAIWFSDLRRSTPLAASLPRDEFIAALNTYFAAAAGAVLAADGEVLRFVGDAVLAIFPIDAVHDAEAACGRAARAARTAIEQLAESNRARVAAAQEPLALGLGLHVGDVMFGNIGVPERLEFSVIGPAANEVARLESLTKDVGRAVVGSRAFVDKVGEPWEPLGPRRLRGVGEPVEVFAMPGA